jgi:hypothetical protein
MYYYASILTPSSIFFLISILFTPINKTFEVNLFFFPLHKKTILKSFSLSICYFVKMGSFKDNYFKDLFTHYQRYVKYD